jgi:putative membrane protein
MIDPAARRRPQSFEDDPATVIPAPPLEEEANPAAGPAAPGGGTAGAMPGGLATQPAEPVPPGAPGFGWGGLLASTLTGLVLMAAGLWFTGFVAVAVARDDWIGWVAAALLTLAALSAAVLLGKELLGLLRLARISRVRRDAETALQAKDRRMEEEAVGRLKALLAAERAVKWDLERFREEERHMRRPGELIGLADRVLLTAPDREARRLIYLSARRVAVVTAVVPIALIVVSFVLLENVRLVRRIAGAYGGRPGLIGAMRLAWRIVVHMAATGMIAVTDDLVGQFVGQDLLRRLSRKAGEGAFNGAMTARLGVAAVDACRPLPFVAAPPMRARDILAELRPAIDWRALVRRGPAQDR